MGFSMLAMSEVFLTLILPGRNAGRQHRSSASPDGLESAKNTLLLDTSRCSPLVNTFDW